MNKKNYREELIKQSEYDLGTAQAMLKADRNIYCVFMCHLSIEKMLKASYYEILSKMPPKVHSLVFLTQVQGLKLPKDMKEFLESLDSVSIPARYPDELDKLINEYSKNRTQEILKKTEEVLKCLKRKLKK